MLPGKSEMTIPTRLLLPATAALLLAACGEKNDASIPEPAQAREDGMVLIPGGTFRMGSEGKFDTPYGMKFFPEEAPVRTVTVGPFWIDETEVTNDQFAAFVAATGYVTFAERVASLDDFPPEAREFLPPAPFRQGSVVFTEPENFQGDPNSPDAHLAWWRWDPEANWRQPTGTDSSIEGRGNHPVVCIAHEDAAAYAAWAGKRLPTEAEWEFAARGGLSGRVFSWGDEMRPDGKWMANTFQGEFPANNSAADGFAETSHARAFPPNGYGLYDMAGNVWEICADFYDPAFPAMCSGDNPTGPETWVNRTSGRRGEGAAHHVTKGGSFLCHISYCMRYRPAARHSLEEGSPSNHTGFRCARDAEP
jgi:formylglycine-generating enzyme required for sulfatase activity